MMKPSYTSGLGSAETYLSGFRSNELLSAADTLEELRQHNFEVSPILSAAVAKYICDRTEDFTLVSDKGLLRLRYTPLVECNEF